MYLEIISGPKINEILQTSEAYFPEEYIVELKKKPSYRESLVSRFAISTHIEKMYWKKMYLPQIDSSGTPAFDDTLYWSISHKNLLLMLGVSEKPLGVDIELLEPRGEALFTKHSKNEYALLWWQNWENFYFLWTAKESIIKYQLGGLDDLIQYKLLQVSEIDKEIWGIRFSKELIFFREIWAQYFQVLSWSFENQIYSLCC